MFTANGHLKHLMERTLRHTLPGTNQLNRRSHLKKLLFLLYVKGVCTKVECICFPLDVKVISRLEHTLRQSLMKVKTTRPEEKRRGVIYEIPCVDCNCVYVGETG